jgi:hypothetical protein
MNQSDEAKLVFLEKQFEYLEKRIDAIDRNFEYVEKRMDKVEEKLDGLYKIISNNQSQIIKVIIGTTGTVIVGLISILTVALTSV